MGDKQPVKTIGIDQEQFSSWVQSMEGGNGGKGRGNNGGGADGESRQTPSVQDHGRDKKEPGNGENIPALATSRQRRPNPKTRLKSNTARPTATAAAGAAPSSSQQRGGDRDGRPRNTKDSDEGVGGGSSSKNTGKAGLTSTGSTLTRSTRPQQELSMYTTTLKDGDIKTYTSTYTLGAQSSGSDAKPTESSDVQKKPSSKTDDDNEGAPVAMIAGISVGVCAVILLAFITGFLIRRYKQKIKLHKGEKSRDSSGDHRFSTISAGFVLDEKGGPVDSATSSRTRLTSAAAAVPTVLPVLGGPPDSPASQRTMKLLPRDEGIKIDRSAKSSTDGLGLVYVPKLQLIRHEPELDISLFSAIPDPPESNSPDTPTLMKEDLTLPEPPVRASNSTIPPGSPGSNRGRSNTRLQSGHSYSHSNSPRALPPRKPVPSKNPSFSVTSLPHVSALSKPPDEPLSPPPNHHVAFVRKNRTRSQTANSMSSNKSMRSQFDFLSDRGSPAVANLAPYRMFPKSGGTTSPCISVHSGVGPISPPPQMPLPSPTLSENLQRSLSTSSRDGSRMKLKTPNIMMAIDEAATAPDSPRRSTATVDELDAEKLLVDSGKGDRSSIISFSTRSNVLHIPIGITKFKSPRDSSVVIRRLTERSMRSSRTLSSATDSGNIIPGHNLPAADEVQNDSNKENLPPKFELEAYDNYRSTLSKSSKRDTTMSDGLNDLRSTERVTSYPYRNSLSHAPRVASSVYSQGTNKHASTMSLRYSTPGEKRWQMAKPRGLSVIIQKEDEVSIPLETLDRTNTKESVELDNEETFIGTAKQVDVISLNDNDSRVSVSTIVSRNSKAANGHMSVDSRGVSPRFSTISNSNSPLSRSNSPMDMIGNPLITELENAASASATTAVRQPTGNTLTVTQPCRDPVSPEPLHIVKSPSPPSTSPEAPTIPEDDEKSASALITVMNMLEAKSRWRLSPHKPPRISTTVPPPDDITQQRPKSSQHDEKTYSSSTMRFFNYYRSSRYSHPDYRASSSMSMTSPQPLTPSPSDPVPPLPFNLGNERSSPTLVAGLPGSTYQSRPMSIPASNVKAFKEAMQLANLPSLNVDAPTPSATDIQLLGSPFTLFAPTMQRASLSTLNEVENVQPSIAEVSGASEDDEEEEVGREREEGASNTTFDTALSTPDSGTPPPVGGIVVVTSSPFRKTPKKEGTKTPEEKMSGDAIKNKSEVQRQEEPFDFGDIFAKSRGW